MITLDSPMMTDLFLQMFQMPLNNTLPCKWSPKKKTKNKDEHRRKQKKTDENRWEHRMRRSGVSPFRVSRRCWKSVANLVAVPHCPAWRPQHGRHAEGPSMTHPRRETKWNTSNHVESGRTGVRFERFKIRKKKVSRCFGIESPRI